MKYIIGATSVTGHRATLETVLQRVHADIVTLDKDAKTLVPHQKRLVEAILKTMKEIDPLFRHLSPTIYWTGSYYENTKVTKADEFDVNIVLNFPPYSMQVVTDGVPSSMARVRLKEKFLKRYGRNEDYAKLLNFTGSSGCLKQDKIRHWMESIIEKALTQLKHTSKLGTIFKDKISVKKSGPAFTLHVKTNFKSYDVDIVPAIAINQIPKSFQSKITALSPSTNQWFAIPKPRSNEPKDDTCWRTSFSEQEREILLNKQSLLPTFRLLKRLRDNQRWSRLSSYYLKTVFLWEVQQQDAQFWENSLTVLFLHMLRVLCKFLHQKSIPYFWDSRYNLMKNVSDAEMNKMRNRLTKIIHTLENESHQNPYAAGCVFCQPIEAISETLWVVGVPFNLVFWLFIGFIVAKRIFPGEVLVWQIFAHIFVSLLLLSYKGKGETKTSVFSFIFTNILLFPLVLVFYDIQFTFPKEETQ